MFLSSPCSAASLSRSSHTHRKSMFFWSFRNVSRSWGGKIKNLSRCIYHLDESIQQKKTWTKKLNFYKVTSKQFFFKFVLLKRHWDPEMRNRTKKCHWHPEMDVLQQLWYICRKIEASFVGFQKSLCFARLGSICVRCVFCMLDTIFHLALVSAF